MTQEAGKETTEPDNVNVGLIATVTIVGALLTVSTAAALTALVRSESGSHETAVGAHANLGAVDRLKAEQIAKLEGPPAWSRRETGQVSVPIGRAMELVAADIQRNPYLATYSPPKPKEQPDAGPDAAAAAPPAPSTPAAPTAASPAQAPAPAAPAAPAPAAPPVAPAAPPGGRAAAPPPPAAPAAPGAATAVSAVPPSGAPAP